MHRDTTMTIGCDLGDRFSELCFVDEVGKVVKQCRCTTSSKGFDRVFKKMASSTVVIEAGTHSPWVSRLLDRYGHRTVVANPRNIQLITKNHRKSDKKDAELLARLARADETLLSPICHRGESAQQDLAIIRSRAALVQTRASLVNHVRGTVKANGFRLQKCTTPAFTKRAWPMLSEKLQAIVHPVFKVIDSVSEQIKALDKQIEVELPERHSDITRLTQVTGVGPITAAAFVLTIDNPHRFAKSRQVGAYLGLAPRRTQSGRGDPELRISKTGDRQLRVLLVSAAQYILGPFGPDCDLRRWGQGLSERGKKNAKKRAVVAVARRLAVLLHRLWVSGEVYEPNRHESEK
jgi:transposase